MALAAGAALRAAHAGGERGDRGRVPRGRQHAPHPRRALAAAEGRAAVEERRLAHRREVAPGARCVAGAHARRRRAGLPVPGRDRAAGARGPAGRRRAGAGGARGPGGWPQAAARDGAGHERVGRGLAGARRGVRCPGSSRSEALHRGRRLALVQCCTVHELRNLERKVPAQAYDEIEADHHRIVYAASLAEARKAWFAFVRRWTKPCPGVVASLERAATGCSVSSPSRPSSARACAPSTRSKGSTRRSAGA